MNYKCISYSCGVVVSTSTKAFFTFNADTHALTDLGGGRVRISRRIDNFVELLSEPIGVFVTIDGDSVATTFAELDAYFNTVRADVGIQAAIDALTAKDIELAGLVIDLQAGAATASDMVDSFGLRVDAIETASGLVAPRLTEVEASIAAQDLLVQAATAKNSAQDVRLDDLDASKTNHSQRVEAIEGVLPTKADLVSGKIPMSQLPDLPVGRKVSVANAAARLALPLHPDLTIAYELDTADAWVLAANASPADAGNWEKLGNSAGVGVASFNGRTGNVAPQADDYITDQIAETLTKTFVTDTDRTNWNGKASPTTVNVAVAGLRAEAEAAYLTKGQRGVANGVAGLGSDGKVPTSQLPTQGMTTAQAQRLTDTEAAALLANQKGDSAASNILAVDSRLSQVESDGKAAVAQAKAASIPTAQKGAASGVATLGADGKVPSSQLPAASDISSLIPLSQKGVANGVATLDANSKVPLGNLPVFMPQRARIWRDNKQAYNTWLTNTTGAELELYIRTGAISDLAAYLLINLRSNSAAATLAFADTLEPMPAGNRYIAHQVTVPAGWQYAVTIAGGATFTIANIAVWRELS